VVYVTWAARVRNARARAAVFLKWKFHADCARWATHRALTSRLGRRYAAGPFRTWARVAAVQVIQRRIALVAAAELDQRSDGENGNVGGYPLGVSIQIAGVAAVEARHVSLASVASGDAATEAEAAGVRAGPDVAETNAHMRSSGHITNLALAVVAPVKIGAETPAGAEHIERVAPAFDGSAKGAVGEEQERAQRRQHAQQHAQQTQLLQQLRQTQQVQDTHHAHELQQLRREHQAAAAAAARRQAEVDLNPKPSIISSPPSNLNCEPLTLNPKP